MTATDSKTVAITTHCDDRKFRVGQFDSIGRGKRPAVHHMQAIGIDELW